MAIFSAVLHLAARPRRIRGNTDMHSDNLINGFNDPDAQVILYLRFINPNSGEIILGFQQANLIFITTFSIW